MALRRNWTLTSFSQLLLSVVMGVTRRGTGAMLPPQFIPDKIKDPGNYEKYLQVRLQEGAWPLIDMLGPLQLTSLVF